jgi:hypothetical protein
MAKKDCSSPVVRVAVVSAFERMTENNQELNQE